MIHLRCAKPEDIDAIDAMLRALSREMDDKHLAAIDTLRQAGFGDYPAFHAQIALSASNNASMGIALYSPLFSTTTGGAGMYLSDLWVAPEQRGKGLSSRLIAAALKDASLRWQASFVKLAVHNDNLPAIAFYDRLGFQALQSAEHYLILKGDAFVELPSHTEAPAKS